MIVSGDVGGTKTLLGVFESAAPRPRLVATHEYATAEYGSFVEILDKFERVAQTRAIDALVIGVAGPVVDNAARLTNIPWDITAAEIANRLAVHQVQLLNDLQALAHSVDVLTADEVSVLQEGTPRGDGNAAVIAAGTGLGQAM